MAIPANRRPADRVAVRRGVWIALEGGEASGKSTQAKRLADALGAVLTREPGATPVGARIRELLLDPTVPALDARAEALLMAADRAEHVARVVRPALEQGRVVVSDRSARRLSRAGGGVAGVLDGGRRGRARRRGRVPGSRCGDEPDPGVTAGG